MGEIPSYERQTKHSSGWVTFEIGWLPGQDRFTDRVSDVACCIGWLPPRCCVCLRETPWKWRLPAGFVPRLDVPICHQCRRYYTRRHAFTIVYVVCVAIVVGLMMYRLLPGLSLLDRIGYWEAVFACGLLCGLIVAQLFSLPVAYGWWFHRRTIRIRFRNPAYAKLLDAEHLP